MSTILEDFVNYLKTDGGCAGSTPVEYHRDVKQYLKFASTQSLSAYTAATVRAFIRSLEGKVSNSTRNRKIAAVKKFSHFLDEDGEKGFAKNIGRVKQETTVPEVLTQEQMTTLLDSIADPFYKALLEALYATGGRIREILLARMDQLDVVSRAIKVMGKGRRERWVFFTDTAWENFEEWLTIRRPDSPYLFCRSETARPPVYSTAWRRLCDYCIASGIPHIATHGFRRGFATHMLESGADLEAVSELMGHSNIATTKVYTNMSKESKRRVVNRLHPRSKQNATS